MKELSIFVDESGDFGKFNEKSPYYIVSFVFHEQQNSIKDQVLQLDHSIAEIGFKNHTIHTAPLVRKEQSYKDVDISIRRKLFYKLFSFTKNIDIFNNDLDNLITDIKAKKGMTEVSTSIREIIENDGFKISDENIAKLTDVVNNSKFNTLSDNDKKLIIMATLLQDSKNIASQTDSIFDVYNVVSKLGMTRQDANKLLNITKGGSFVTDFMKTNKSEKLVTTVTRGDAVLSQERKDLVIEFAWDLKDGNNYELAKMIYQAGEPDGLTRNIDKVIEKEIQRLREKQLVMPQTSQAEIMAHLAKILH